MNHPCGANDGLAVVEGGELLDLHFAALEGDVGLRALGGGKGIDPQERGAALQFSFIAFFGQVHVAVERRNRFGMQSGGGRVGRHGFAPGGTDPASGINSRRLVESRVSRVASGVAESFTQSQ